jgi:hybrid cluster-associated redox disulfide protein
MIIKKQKQKITSDLLIAEIVECYPEVVDYLVDEYEFHCINCVLAGFETLEEGAAAHGITGKEYDKLLNKLNSLVK